MGTTVDKLNKLKVTKEAIRVAINNKGGTLTENDTFASYPTAIENIQTGETNIYVDYLDGDGTLLKREYLNEGDTTTPPSDPNLDSEYLIFDGWSDTEYTNITESKTIYAKYTTKDNATYIFVYIPTVDKTISLSFVGKITSVDWGDSTIDTTLSHTYSAVGYYVIKVVGGTSINTSILGSSTNNQCVLKCYLSDTITSLRDSFNECYSLTRVKLPNNIESIGDYTFQYSYITSIILPSSITQLGTSVFSNCHALTSIVLFSNINEIGGYTFYNCFSLNNIKLPNSITSLGGTAFNWCHSLTSIILPSSITNIGSNAFSGCSALTNINLPSNLISIGNGAFQSCCSLNSISLANNITNLDSNVFLGCYRMQQVIINADSVITIQSNSFWTNSYNTKFYVPDNLVEDYKIATNWVNFADRIYPISSLPKE